MIGRINTPIRTNRLTMIPASAAHVRTELEGNAAFGAFVDAVVPGSWPPGEYDEPAQRFFLQLLSDGGDAVTGWYAWYAIRPAADGVPATVVGSIGFFGPPDQDGVVEIGYSICPQWRGQGLATEMVAALVEHAIRQGGVTHVLAHTTAANPASIAVLTRAGFTPEAGTRDPSLVRFGYTPR